MHIAKQKLVCSRDPLRKYGVFAAHILNPTNKAKVGVYQGFTDQGFTAHILNPTNKAKVGVYQ